jgi:hypothetical protein
VLALAERFASYATAMRGGISLSADVEDAGSAEVYTDISQGVEKRLWVWERTSTAEGAAPTLRVALEGRTCEGCVAWSHQRGRMVRAQSGRQTTVGERPRSNGCVGARSMDSFPPPGSRSRKA